MNVETLKIAAKLCADEESGKHVGAGAMWNEELAVSVCGHCQAIAEALELRGPITFDKRCADALADEVDVLVRNGVISERSCAADALVDYRHPPMRARSDRLLILERDVLRLADAWPLLDILGRLTDGVEHLLTVHGCDMHGHELTRRAQKEARKVIQAILSLGGSPKVER